MMKSLSACACFIFLACTVGLMISTLLIGILWSECISGGMIGLRRMR
jgi:hypothetical protein